METPPRLPLELLEYIADVLGAYNLLPRSWDNIDWNAVRALQMLSLTCRVMVPVCRRHIFARVKFPFCHRRLGELERPSEFFRPPLSVGTRYLKSLYLDIWQSGSKFDKLDYDLLKMICDSSSLTCIELSSETFSSDWHGLSENTNQLSFLSSRCPLSAILNSMVSTDFRSLRCRPALDSLASHSFTASALLRLAPTTLCTAFLSRL